MEYLNTILLMTGMSLSLYYGYQLEFGEPGNKPLNFILLGIGVGITITSLVIIGINAV
jgi:hypothetical protein